MCGWGAFLRCGIAGPTSFWRKAGQPTSVQSCFGSGAEILADKSSRPGPSAATGLWGHLEADCVNRGEVLGRFCGGFRRQLRSSVRGARAAVPASAGQAGDPSGEAHHDSYPADDQDEPRG
jgi:hypothetical protein